MAKANCPECAYEIELDGDVELGEIVMCDNCGADLIVAGESPLVLDSFEEEEK